MREFIISLTFLFYYIKSILFGRGGKKWGRLIWIKTN
jgi:hypothetical protein